MSHLTLGRTGICCVEGPWAPSHSSAGDSNAQDGAEGLNVPRGQQARPSSCLLGSRPHTPLAGALSGAGPLPPRRQALCPDRLRGTTGYSTKTSLVYFKKTWVLFFF